MNKLLSYKNRLIALTLILPIALSLCACTGEDSSSYRIYDSSYQYGITRASMQNDDVPLFADSLCVPPKKNKGTKKVDAKLAKGAGLFNCSTKETILAKNINKKLYPASTTKILTAYLAISYGDLDEVYTVSENAADQAADSSVAGLAAGDQMTLNDLLYGLMLASGNDAAIAIAEGMSGSVDAFCDRMNQEAKRLGATNSHFVTPNGLHDSEHYTTVYDMYLIFNAAMESDTFISLISSSDHTAKYTDAASNAVEKTWTNTNRYLTGNSTAPEGISVIGGKTGTTGEAGYCLVLLSKNSRNEKLVSIVFAAENRWNLYYLMNGLLEQGR